MPAKHLQQAFWSALEEGNAFQIRQLVAAGAQVNEPIGNPGGETPLIRAIGAESLEAVRALLELGAEPNRAWKGPREWTPLMFAHDQPELLEALLTAGAAPQARTVADWVRAPSGRMVQRPGGQTALHLAAIAGNAEAIRVLIQGGAEVEARAEDGCTPLDYAVRAGAVTAAAEALVQAGAQLTPERLAAMHAASSSPDSDLMVFPLPREVSQEVAPAPKESSAGNGTAANPPPATEKPPVPQEIRCPKCQALLYSRKPKFCGQCGALLPAEMLINDAQAQAVDDQRAWARELADKFSTRPAAASAVRRPPVRGGEGAGGREAGSPQELVRRVSCVAEFKHRDRPWFWVTAFGYGALFSVAACVLLKLGVLTPVAVLPITVGFGVLCVRAWHLGSPRCPNCQQNIRVCAARFCHVCGQPLQEGRCRQCGVDSSFAAGLGPSAPQGNGHWITYCPGCGVHLEARMGRWRLGR